MKNNNKYFENNILKQETNATGIIVHIFKQILFNFIEKL
jgi:hypothetical protein